MMHPYAWLYSLTHHTRHAYVARILHNVMARGIVR